MERTPLRSPDYNYVQGCSDETSKKRESDGSSSCVAAGCVEFVLFTCLAAPRTSLPHDDGDWRVTAPALPARFFT